MCKMTRENFMLNFHMISYLQMSLERVSTPLLCAAKRQTFASLGAVKLPCNI